MKIYLVGFMGCGKTKLGRSLADFLKMDQIDLDGFIEESMFMTIAEIFSKHGEEKFREIERQKLIEVSSFDNVIISTGGGAPCFFDNMKIMNSTGTTVFLNPSIKKLADRLTLAKTERPLIKGLNREELEVFIAHKLEQRLPFYEQAKFNIDQDDFTLEELKEMFSL